MLQLYVCVCKSQCCSLPGTGAMASSSSERSRSGRRSPTRRSSPAGAPGRRRKQTPAGKRYARKMLAKRFHRTKRSKEGQGEVALSPIDGRQVIPTPFSVRTVGGSLPTMNVPRNNTGTRCIAAPSGISTVAMGMRRLVAHGRKLTWLRGRRRWS